MFEPAYLDAKRILLNINKDIKIKNSKSWMHDFFCLVKKSNYLYEIFKDWVNNPPSKEILESIKYTINYNQEKNDLLGGIRGVLYEEEENENIDFHFYKYIIILGIDKKYFNNIDINNLLFFDVYDFFKDDFIYCNSVIETDINDLIKYPFNLIRDDYTKLYELTNYWKKHIPSKKILKNIKDYLREDTSIICDIIENLLNYDIIDYIDIYEPELEDIRLYLINFKEKNLKLIDNLLFFGAIINEDEFIEIKKIKNPFDEIYKKLEENVAGQKIAKYVEEAMDDSKEMKPLRTKIDLKKHLELINQK